MTAEIGQSEQQLIAQIERAFSQVRRGNGIGWHEADEIDNRATDEERQSARLLDTDQRWQDVPLQLFDHLPSAVTFLDDEGFRYYLPAFMIADVKQQGRWRSAVNDSFRSNLEWPKRLDGLLPLLTNEQKFAIRNWLCLPPLNPSYENKVLSIWDDILNGRYVGKK